MRWFAEGDRRWLLAFAGVLAMISPHVALAQAGPATATQQLELSAFGAGTGTYTDVLGGRNLGITAGADLAFMTYKRFRPVAEIRGTYPIYKGQIDDQKTFLGGIKVERPFGRLHPYGDFLFGRGSITYKRGLQLGNVVYLKSNTTVYSLGIGLDYDLTRQFAAKGDFQYEHWNAPPIPGGVVHPKALSLGVVYRFDFNHHYRRR